MTSAGAIGALASILIVLGTLRLVSATLQEVVLGPLATLNCVGVPTMELPSNSKRGYDQVITGYLPVISA